MANTTYYYEPNDLEYNAEDLCLGVDLKVEYYSRALDGSRKMEGNVFFGGKNDLLTTSYSDVTILELEGGGNKESIGIESINIKYNSWYFPEVNIKFIDIRGNSIFNSMEMTNDEKTKDSAKGSFLKAFFTFPYPMFQLTVKGYFGQPVTYRLTVKDVPKATFNSSTGNFEMSVNFIGHMYYYLTDIPMSLIMAAPYIQYGSNKKDLEGGLPTFVDLLKQLNSALTDLNDDPRINQLLLDIENKRTESTKLTDLNNELVNAQQILNIFEIEEPTEVVNLHQLLSVKNDASLPNGYNNISSVFNYLYGIRRKLFDIYDNSEFIDSLVISKNQELSPPQLDRISRTYVYPFKYYYNFDENGDYSKIQAKKNMITEEIAELTEQEESITRDILKNHFDKTLSLEKVIQITLAHLKKFHDNVKTCMTNISNKSGSRKSKTIKYKTDCNTSSNITLYPFTGFLNDRNEYVWIGEAVSENAGSFPEINFVNTVLRGVSEFQNEMDEVAREGEIILGEGDFPRLGLYGILMDIKNAATDYYKTQMTANGGLSNYCRVNDTNTLPPVFKDLAKRTVLSYIFCGIDYTQNTFGGVEGLKLLKQGFNRDVYSPTTLWGSLENSNMRVRQLFFNLVKEEYKKFMIEFGENTDLNYNIYNEIKRYKIKRKTCNYLGYDIDFFRYEQYDPDASVNDGDFWKPKDILTYAIPQKFVEIDNMDNYNANVNACKQYISSKSVNDSKYLDVFYLDKNITKLRDIVGLETENLIIVENGVETEVKFVLDSKTGSYNLGNIGDFWDKVKYFKNHSGITENIIIQSGQAAEDKDDNCIKYFFKTVLNHVDKTDKILKEFQLGGCMLFNRLAYIYMGNFLKLNPTLEFKNPRLEIIYNSGIKDKILAYYEQNKKDIANKIRNCFSEHTEELNSEQKERLKELLMETVCLLSPCKMDNEQNVNFEAIFTPLFRLDGVEEKFNEKMGDIAFAQTDVIEKFLKVFNNEVGGDNTDNGKVKSIVNENDSKRLATYDIFKHLYDRWKYGANNSMKHEITVNDFVFRDTLNRSISNLTINIDKLSKLLLSIKQGETDMSLYQFLFDVCNISDCLLLPLPLNVYDTIDSNDKIEKIFTPYDYSYVRDSEISSKFVVTYRQKDSQFLNFSADESEYADDGFDFTNDDVEKTTDMKKIRAFGVTYGLGNQRYFKDIQVSMDKPMVTEHSIASTMYIAENGNKKGGTKFGMVYQDVFDTYSNHSYQCTVEMMGDMQIMPMMYFQLNNVPLFKGGYMITSVEHNITNQGMKTNFTGNRVNKNHFQYARNEIKKKKKRRTTNNSSNSNNDTNTTPQTNAADYTKDNSIIVIEAGLAMDYGVDSNGPTVDVINVNPESFESPSIYDIDVDFRDVEPESIIKESGNTNGILYPFLKDGVQSNTMLYRQYWGNIKIADELYDKLRDKGYNVSKSYQSDIKSKFYEKPQITTGEELNGKKVIILNLHGNTLSDRKPISWNAGNYCQFFYQSVGDGAAKHTNTSKKLAKCLETKFKEFFDGFDLKVNNAKVEIKESAVINTNVDDKRGIVGYAAPAVLCKTLFSDTKEHVKFLSYKDNRTALVNAYVNGIEKFFNDLHNESRATDDSGLFMPPNAVYEGSRYTWYDLTYSNKARNRRKQNIPNQQHQANLSELCRTILEPLCDRIGETVHVDSGYRSPELNNSLEDSSPTSQHMRGEAADLDRGDSLNREVFDTLYSMIEEGTITVGQLIWEKGQWDDINFYETHSLRTGVTTTAESYPGWVHVSLGTKNDIKVFVGNDTYYPIKKENGQYVRK